jgi:hypothetical protein
MQIIWQQRFTKRVNYIKNIKNKMKTMNTLILRTYKYYNYT